MKLLLKFLFLSLALSSSVVQGQMKKSGQKFLLGFNFSTDYNFRTLKKKDNSSNTDLVLIKRNELEIAKFGFTSGINIYIDLLNQMGFETGLQYSNRGYKTKNQELVYFPPDPASPSEGQFNYAYQYVGIPVRARFSLGRNKLRFISSIGFITNFLLDVKNIAKYKYADGRTISKTESISGFKKIDISLVNSIGIDYKLNDNFHLTAEPTFRYGLIKTKDAAIRENLWNAGLNIGFYYGVK